MKKILCLTLFNFLFLSHGIAQFTMVPDAAFEQYLVDEGIDSDGIVDGQFLTADALGVTELLIDNLPIAELTGIEAFTDLERLDARNNNFTTANFSSNIQLDQLTIANGPLSSINITQNTNLLTLIIENCELTSIDISNNTNLSTLVIGETNLSSIDLSNNTNLSSVGVGYNNLTEIDVSNNPSLVFLGIVDNSITTLDVTNLSLLRSLFVYENNLTSLDLSGNPQLDHLICSDNFLTQLDLTNNPLIEKVSCNDNQITEVDFGQTYNLEEFISIRNPVISYDFADMPALERLYVGENELTNLDVSNCPSLKYLICWYNNISSPLDLTQNPNLEWLYCNDNPIPGIDVTQCPNIDEFFVNNTLVTTLDLSKNRLDDFAKLRDMPNLQYVDVRNGNNENLSFDSIGSPNLSCVLVDDATSGEGTFFIDPHTTLVNNEQECDALGLEDYLLANTSIYPNPATNRLHIDTPNYFDITSMQLVDVLGQRVYQWQEFQQTIDLTQLNSGVYFLKMAVGPVQITKKLVKQ